MTNKKEKNLIQIEKFLKKDEKINIDNDSFRKIMFIYSTAMKDISTKLEAIKDEFKIFYNYDLIEHINTRIKTPQSILNKLEKKNCKPTYKEMIEHVNDIAGIRVICMSKKDIFTTKNIIEQMPGMRILKEKDYITKPKDSGYSSYHIIMEVPIILSQKVIYVKVEIQIRTVIMDFWASIEHKMKYKPQGTLNKATSKELVRCARIVDKLEKKMMLLK